MRLIDADTLIECLVDDYCSDCSKCGSNCRHDELFSIIDAQPTAFNVDAVVDQLKENSEIYCKEYHQREGSLYLQDAIEIVRKGGVHE